MKNVNRTHWGGTSTNSEPLFGLYSNSPKSTEYYRAYVYSAPINYSATVSTLNIQYSAIQPSSHSHSLLININQVLPNTRFKFLQEYLGKQASPGDELKACARTTCNLFTSTFWLYRYEVAWQCQRCPDRSPWSMELCKCDFENVLLFADAAIDKSHEAMVFIVIDRSPIKESLTSSFVFIFENEVNDWDKILIAEVSS